MARRFAVVIPARYASTRLPGKPLLEMGGKPMIQWVYEAALRSLATSVVVATDDGRIQDAVSGFGGRVVMTSPDHVSGTDRVAQAALDLSEEVIVNVQGDEPLLDPALINQVAAPLLADASIPMSTLAYPIGDVEDIFNANVVKVVCNLAGFALYFSRASIPFDRDRFSHEIQGVTIEDVRRIGMLRHVGLYGYRADFLQTFASLQSTTLEGLERLEQLRVLEHGYGIRVMIATGRVQGGVDVPEDLLRVRGVLATFEQKKG